MIGVRRFFMVHTRAINGLTSVPVRTSTLRAFLSFSLVNVATAWGRRAPYLIRDACTCTSVTHALNFTHRRMTRPGTTLVSSYSHPRNSAPFLEELVDLGSGVRSDALDEPLCEAFASGRRTRSRDVERTLSITTGARLPSMVTITSAVQRTHSSHHASTCMASECVRVSSVYKK